MNVLAASADTQLKERGSCLSKKLLYKNVYCSPE